MTHFSVYDFCFTVKFNGQASKLSAFNKKKSQMYKALSEEERKRMQKDARKANQTCLENLSEDEKRRETVRLIRTLGQIVSFLVFLCTDLANQCNST